MNAGAVAMPALVLTVAEEAKVPLAPLAGAVNVTGIAFCKLPDSVTVALRSVAKIELIVALCGVPAVAVMA